MQDEAHLDPAQIPGPKRHRGDGVAVRESCRVPVLAPDGQPLTPARPERVRSLLDTKRARVRWLTGRVFAIQLLAEPSGREVVPLRVGIDDGARHVGVSVVMERRRRPAQEVLSVQAELPQGIKERMERRRNYRRTRRYRKGYRKTRFLNRQPARCHVCGRNARAGRGTCRGHVRAGRSAVPAFAPWLAPSQKARKDGILRVIRTLGRVVPLACATVTVEVGRFDLQALANPDLRGAEYQHGPRYGHDSTLGALVAAYGEACCYCGEKATAEDPLTIDHWVPRAQGGTDRWGNLVAAHRSCNERKGACTPKEAGLAPRYAPRQLQQTVLAVWASRTQQGRGYLAHGLVALGLEYRETYGAYTAWARKATGTEKSHRADARIVATTAYRRRRRALGTGQRRARLRPPRKLPRRVRFAGAPNVAKPGLRLTAHLRASGGHAVHQATCYRVREVAGDRMVLSVRTKSGVKVKKTRVAQVAVLRRGAVLRTEVNRAVVIEDLRVEVLPAGQPVPSDPATVIEKGALAEARVGRRRITGIVTVLWTSGAVGVSAAGRTVRCAARRVRVMARSAGCLLHT